MLYHTAAAVYRSEVQVEGMFLPVLYDCAPSRPLGDSVFSLFDEGMEGMILRGLVLLGPPPLSEYCSFLPG